MSTARIRPIDDASLDESVFTIFTARIRIIRSDYRKFLLGDFIRIHLKIEQNCRLSLDIGNSHPYD